MNFTVRIELDDQRVLQCTTAEFLKEVPGAVAYLERAFIETATEYSGRPWRRREAVAFAADLTRRLREFDPRPGLLEPVTFDVVPIVWEQLNERAPIDARTGRPV